RTHETVTRLHALQACAFSRSATYPELLDAQTRSKYQDRASLATGPGAAKPPPLPRVYLESLGATLGEERRMNTLPKKREPGEAPEVNAIPTWRQLADRFRDLMKAVLTEGKEREREREPKLLPALKRLKLENERLIGKHAQLST